MGDISCVNLDASKCDHIFTCCLLYVKRLIIYFMKNVMQINFLFIRAVCHAYSFSWSYKIYAVSRRIIISFPLDSCRLDNIFSLDLSE
jgi:hypothetical protein